MLRKNEVKNTGNNYKSSLLLSRFLGVVNIGPLVALTLWVLIFTLINPFFISISNVKIILLNASFTGIISFGMAMVFITGQFDLSAAGVATLTAITAAYFMVLLSWPVWISILMAFLMAIMVGLVNGFLIVKLKITPLVATLGMMFILIGAVKSITEGYGIYPLPEVFNNIGKAKIFGISWIIIIFIIIAILFDFILRKTTFGRKVYATGADVRVARLMGINTNLIKMLAYVVVSLFAALSGILYMSYIRSGTTEIAGDWILLIIAGVVIGGVSVFGGQGNIIGVTMGALVVWTMRSGLTMIGARSEFQLLAIGGILIISTVFDYFKRRSRSSD